MLVFLTIAYIGICFYCPIFIQYMLGYVFGTIVRVKSDVVVWNKTVDEDF